MRFLKKKNSKKTILVISDIHLGAGTICQGQRNCLEDFHHDTEFVEFINYFSQKEYATAEVELIINGDFLDHLAVPFVEYHDDEFWSEEAALEKTKIIVNAHSEVFQSLVKFVQAKNKTIIYQIGNHDAELVFPSCQEYLLNLFPDTEQDKVIFRSDGNYEPHPGILIKHGHEFEYAHQFDPDEVIFENAEGKKYFKPPWGSYYVTRIVNKFKSERSYINQIRPIKYFLINGLLFDTLLTIRFMIANVFYFLMVRFLTVYRRKDGFQKIMNQLKSELSLFVDLEEHTQEFFHKNPHIKALIIGHTHEPCIKDMGKGQLFINTGTWTKMHYLDYSGNNGFQLTFAQIDIDQENTINIELNEWFSRSSKVKSTTLFSTLLLPFCTPLSVSIIPPLMAFLIVAGSIPFSLLNASCFNLRRDVSSMAAFILFVILFA